MASLLYLAETLNLLELVEATPNDLSALWELFESATYNEKANRISRGDHSPCTDDPNRMSLAELSLCTDEGGDGGVSDVRLKTDIARVGTTVYGLPLYHFRYKTGTERFEGVMAQDVLEVMPDALVVGADGYYRVKYGQLGIRMTRA
jgi:hypothetical protein